MEPVQKFRDKQKAAKNQFDLYKYYYIVAIVSLIAVFFLPMLGTDPTLGVKLPTTFIGWMIYIVTKICVAAINLMLFHCFMAQGHLNVKDHPLYIEACKILQRYGLGPAGQDPLGPEEWQAKQYKSKGVSIAVTSVLSAVVLTQAIFQFDGLSMLTYLITIVLGVIFGLLQQDTAETYWTDEFYRYAKKIEIEMESKYANKE